MTTADVIGLVSAVVSIALAVFAIWQATTYYRWSKQAQQDAQQAARDIQSSVGKLETLFNRFYSDTFGIMRETVQDMRAHMWPSASESTTAVEEIEARTQENLSKMRAELMGEITAVAERAEGAVTPDVLENAIDRAISGSREAEAEAVETTARERLLAHLVRLARTGARSINAFEAWSWMQEQGFKGEFFPAVGELRSEGFVSWPERDEGTDPVEQIAPEDAIIHSEAPLPRATPPSISGPPSKRRQPEHRRSSALTSVARPMRRSTDHLYVTPVGPRERHVLAIIEERPASRSRSYARCWASESRIWQIVGRLQRGRVRFDPYGPI